MKKNKKHVKRKKDKVFDKDDWRIPLEAAVINDDQWYCMVAIMMETIVEHSWYLLLFHDSVEEIEQTCIYSLSYQKAIDTVRTLSKRDPEKCLPIEHICHYASIILDENNGHLSTWLVARIIKFLIYRKKLKVDLVFEIENPTSPNDGTTSTRNESSPGKTDEVEVDKANTFLHLDAMPLDEPNLFVVLTGFRDPDLLVELLQARVPMVCILDVRAHGVDTYVTYHDMENNDPPNQGELKFPQNYLMNDRKELQQFWNVTNQRFANLPAHPAYLDIAMLGVYPPSFSDDTNEHTLKRNMYDEVLITLCHLYDVCRLYADYIRSMRLQEGLTDKIEEMDTRVYEDTLKDVPNEYVTVPLVLCAILLQVEANLAVPAKEAANDELDRAANKPPKSAKKLVASVREKLHVLNHSHEISDKYIDVSCPLLTDELKVIPYADVLRMITEHFSKTTDLDDGVLHILQDRRIVDIWRGYEAQPRAKSEAYACHVSNIARQFNECTVSDEEVMDYLHLLVFEKWIFEIICSPKAWMSSDQPIEWNGTRAIIRCAPDLELYETSSTTSVTMFGHHPCRSKSDSEIDYKPVTAFTDCRLLFALTDTRETLLPGYLYENVWRTRTHDRPNLAEYTDVELFSARTFLQVVYQCFQNFNCFVARYFEPTDSMLLYFSNHIIADSTFEYERVRTIRTPVGLWEFCKYVAMEEENWIKWHEEKRRMDAEKFMEKTIEIEEQMIIFEDERFILSDSLKAQLKKRISKVDVMIDKTDRPSRIDMEPRKILVKKHKDENEDEDEEEVEEEEEEEEEEKKLLGYDIFGRIRVQTTYKSRRFIMANDTSVRLKIENWLYSHLDLHLAVFQRHCTLRMSTTDDHHRLASAFQLITKGGIVLSFSQNWKQPAALGNSSDQQRRNLAFDFRASWPSGLLIEPAIGDGTKNPFYIRQSYLSKCPGRAAGAREVCRDFLRNGSVLKYLDDNTVVILRSNGIIVTCIDYDERSHDEFIQWLAETNLTGLDTRGFGQSETAKHAEKIATDQSLFDQSDSSIQQITDEHMIDNEDIPPITEKELRYRILNYDGRHYELLNDQFICEYDQLLVRTTTDYEVDEMLTRRADGTNTLFCSNGEMIVSFPDGTRIITNCVVEEQPIICDLEMRNDIEEYEDEFEDTFVILEDEAFVSVLLTFRMEHKDYVTVCYEQLAVTCTLSMPGNVQVNISETGYYEVSIFEFNLKTYDDKILLTEMCATCGASSRTVLSIWEERGVMSQTILMTTDILGNELLVKTDGSAIFTILEKNLIDPSQEKQQRDDEDEGEGEDEDDEEEEDNEEAGNSEKRQMKEETRIYHKHERCKTFKLPARSQYRIFALNRDLTAREYLHRSVRREQELAVFGDERCSMMQYPISRRPELCRLITFVPMELELGSKELPCQLPISYERRTDYETSQLSRSTFDPHNWLFPFGKRNHLVSEENDQAKLNELSLPKLLRVRVFFGIKEEYRNILIDMQRVLGRYWISVFFDGDKCRLSCTRLRVREIEDDYENLERLHELALGVRQSIDVETYVRGLRGKLIKAKPEVTRQTSRLVKLHEWRTSMEREYEWYKQCMRKRIIMPYFQNVTESCYILNDLIDEVIEISKRNHVAKRKDDNLV